MGGNPLRMKVRIAIPLLLAACAPANESIGRTEWAVETTGANHGVVGPAGHVLLTEGGYDIELLEPDGERAWSVSCPRFCYGGAVDAEGNAYLDLDDDGLELVKLAAADGAVEWSLAFDTGSASDVVVGSDGAVWLVLNGSESIDLGGGPVGGTGLGGRWARFASNGTHLASGAVDFVVDPWLARPLPQGGLLLGGRGALQAIDETGDELWRVSRVVSDVTVHEDGELTLAQLVPRSDGSDGWTELVRLDSDRNVRWSHSVASNAQITPLAAGDVMAFGSDGLADDDDVSYLELVEASGDAQREVFEDFILLFTGPPFDGYRFANVTDRSIIARSLR